jgi:hypothetical protein
MAYGPKYNNGKLGLSEMGLHFDVMQRIFFKDVGRVRIFEFHAGEASETDFKSMFKTGLI